MIDYVKLRIINKIAIDRIWNNGNLVLEYRKETIDRYGNPHLIEVRRYGQLRFFKGGKGLYITGSLHQHYNGRQFNGNDFTIHECMEVIKSLEKVGIRPEECQIINLEFGVNIDLGFPVRPFIDALLIHGRNHFFADPKNKYSKVSASHNEVGRINDYKSIKAYAKGLQFFELPETIFRWEISSNQSKYIRNQTGIETMADLLNIDTYCNLANILLMEWERVIISFLQISKKNKNITKYESKDFWNNTLKCSRNNFSYHFNKYKHLIEEYPDNWHTKVESLLFDKLEEVLHA